MQTVGIDLHRSRSQVAVLDDAGKQIVSRRITNSPEAFLQLLAGVDRDCGSRSRRRTAGSGWRTSCSAPATSCTWRTRRARRRSRRRA
jgi:hypothetical protein